MSITITSPNNGAVVSGTITVTATVNVATKGFSGSSLYVDGVLRGTGSEPSISISLDTTTLSNETHSLVVKAKIKGVVYTSQTVVVSVQNVASSSISQSIVQGSTLSGTVAWSATLSNITTTSGVRFAVDGATKTTDASAPYSYSLDTTQLADGTHTFLVETQNTSGAYFTKSVTATVQNVVTAAPVNTSPPTISGSVSQSLPFSTVLDNANRANENPLSQGGAWTALTGLPPLKIVSNQFAASAAFSYGYRGSYTDVEVGVTLGTVAASENAVELMMRLKDSGGVSPIRESNKSGYSVTFFGKDTYQINKMTAGSYTTLRGATSWLSGPLADGDSIGCRMVGSTIEVWAKRGANAWFKEFSMTDTTHSAAGAIGMGLEGTTTTLDDFRGAAVVSATYQEGATLTAAKGTWTGTPTPTYTYQWLRCDSAGANPVAITGATNTSYVLVSADVGKTIRIRVKATNSAAPNGVTADSAATAVIIGTTPPPPPPPTGSVVEINGTVSAATFQSLVSGAPAGAITVRPVAGQATFTVTGEVTLSRQNVTIQKAVILSRFNLGSSASGFIIEDSRLKYLEIDGASNWTLRRNVLDGELNIGQNFIYRATNWQILNNTFRNYYIPSDPTNHSEALYIGSGCDGGLIQGNTFDYNGTTAHIFFTYWDGTLENRARNICVTLNTFTRCINGGNHVKLRDPDYNTDAYGIRVDPDNTWDNSASVLVAPSIALLSC